MNSANGIIYDPCR